MIARGARGTDQDFQAILDYLATNFLGEASRPLNINTATPVELESVLLLLRKEAAAVIAYTTPGSGPNGTSLLDSLMAPGTERPGT